MYDHYVAALDRDLNDCIAWAEIVLGDAALGEAMFLLSPAQVVEWEWMPALRAARGLEPYVPGPLRPHPRFDALWGGETP
jgi:hypothetical protein